MSGLAVGKWQKEGGGVRGEIRGGEIGEEFWVDRLLLEYCWWARLLA